MQGSSGLKDREHSPASAIHGKSEHCEETGRPVIVMNVENGRLIFNAPAGASTSMPGIGLAKWVSERRALWQFLMGA